MTEKNQKKRSAKKMRSFWTCARPVTQAVPNKKAYNRKRELVDKTPADGLCGKTDEDNLGITYAQIDDYIMRGTCGIMSIDYAISEMNRRNLHKLERMPAFPGY